MVERCVDLGVFDGFGYVFNADDFAGLAGYKVGDGARPGVEVEDEFVSGQPAIVSHLLVEVVGLFVVGLVETLGTYLEAEVFHQLVDVACSLVHMNLQIAEGIVTLEVVDPNQGGDFGELTHNVVEHLAALLFFVGLGEMELEEQQYFARVGGAKHHVTQYAGLVAQVEEADALFEGEAAYAVAHAVLQGVHEVAVFDVEHLVEGPGYMKSESVELVVLHAAADFFGGEPSLVAEGELYLVAIVFGVLGSDNRCGFGQFHLADASQRVDYLLLFAGDLAGVAEVLPFAAAAYFKVGAHGADAVLGIVVELDDAGFAVAVFLARHLQVDDVARGGVGYEYHQVVDTGHGLSLGGKGGYFYLF